MIKFQTTSNQRKIAKMRRLVLDHSVHYTTLTSGIKTVCSDTNYNIYTMTLAFDGNVPVGTCIISDPVWGYTIVTYVKPPYRRRHIGMTMVNRTIRYNKYPIELQPYLLGGRQVFYNKTKVSVVK